MRSRMTHLSHPEYRRHKRDARSWLLAGGRDYHDVCLMAGVSPEAMRGRVRWALPDGYEAQIRPRSGLALKDGLTVLNSPGTIDADYRGEICVILINLGETAASIKPGDRIAQMVIAPLPAVELVPVAHLPETARGEGGLVSTGR